jgi:hypothetical protein
MGAAYVAADRARQGVPDAPSRPTAANFPTCRVDRAAGKAIHHRILASGRKTKKFTRGEWPQNAGLVQTPDGTLYGVTGGNPDGTTEPSLCSIGNIATAGCGTLYTIDTAGRFSQLHTLSNGDGAYRWSSSQLTACVLASLRKFPQQLQAAHYGGLLNAHRCARS